MKKRILLPLLLLCGTPLLAQKDFHGEIIYSIRSSIGNKTDARLNIIFAENRIKLRFKEKEDYDKEELLLKLDSGISYAINYKDSTFRKRKLARFPEITLPEKRSIAGYSTTPVGTNNNGLLIAMSSFAEVSTQVIYLADSLFYHIPPSLAGNTELVAIQNNRIVLGIKISRREREEDDSMPGEMQESLVATALSVNAFEPVAADMELPAGFTDRREIKEPYADSISTTPAIDTVVAAPKLKKAIKAPAKPKSKPVAGKTKQAARKPKE